MSILFPENFGFREDQFDEKTDCVERFLAEAFDELGVSLLLQEYTVSTKPLLLYLIINSIPSFLLAYLANCASLQ